MTTRTFDWKPRHDPRSRNYPARALTGPREAIKRTRILWLPPIRPLDQDEEGACSPHAWVHEALTSPVRVDFTNVNIPPEWPRDAQAFAFALYAWCQRNDEWEGEDYSGTSVLAGAKGMKELGFIREYRWAFSIQELIDSLLTIGPVVIGIPWLDGMYEAPGGEVTVAGEVVGGHALLVIGYEPEHRWLDGTVSPAAAWLNSWGATYGANGLAWVRIEDLARLLADYGEACVPVKRSYRRPKPVPPVVVALRRVARRLFKRRPR